MFLRRFWCKHEYEFIRNIYGDEIFEWAGHRSIWKCSKCGKISSKERLNDV